MSQQTPFREDLQQMILLPPALPPDLRNRSTEEILTTLLPHCKNCRHWDWPWQKDLGRCELGGSDGGGMQVPTALAVALDYEDRGADLATKAEFGCVQFQARE